MSEEQETFTVQYTPDEDFNGTFVKVYPTDPNDKRMVQRHLSNDDRLTMSSSDVDWYLIEMLNELKAMPKEN